jgi:hypothetical protein
MKLNSYSYKVTIMVTSHYMFCGSAFLRMRRKLETSKTQRSTLV